MRVIGYDYEAVGLSNKTRQISDLVDDIVDEVEQGPVMIFRIFVDYRLAPLKTAGYLLLQLHHLFKRTAHVEVGILPH